MAQVQLTGIKKSYGPGDVAVPVLDGVDLEVDKGEVLVILGPSGSGKTTLLNLVGGLDQADSGEVLVAGEDLGHLSGAELARWRAESIGFVTDPLDTYPIPE
jgi:putative ABC transport system ATP-binding protein